MKHTSIGIVGCGTIGTALATYVCRSTFPGMRNVYLMDTDNTQAQKIALLCARSSKKSKHLTIQAVSRAELLKRSSLVVEAASMSVAGPLAEACLKKHKDIVVLSVGGVALNYKRLASCAARSRGTLYIPSGALCGIDGVLAAGKTIAGAKLITRKPLKGLQGAPYLTKRGIDLRKIKKETLLFSGTAEEALKHFPQNINVAAVLSLAGCGIKKTIVEIVTSPTYTRNTHEVHITGKSGTITTITSNEPSPSNPKTSYMAILSACALLKKLFSPIKIGT